MTETEQNELRVIDDLADAYSRFSRLPPCHDSDLKEFEAAIHTAQNIVMARSAVRRHPDVFKRRRGFK